MSSFTLFSKAS